MGFKLSIILFTILLGVTGGSVWYIDRLQDNIAVLKANAIVLESKVAEQNASIKNYLAQQEKNQEQINQLTLINQDAQREVNKLRDTFARHDLDALALAKPVLIQNRVNKATRRVKDELVDITNPNQFNEEPSDQ